jgi:hypothetical protein
MAVGERDTNGIMMTASRYTSIESLQRAVASIPAVLLSLLSVAKPSFIGGETSEPRKLRPTSYLDGLRGVAALFVVFNHYVAEYFPDWTYGYLSGDGSEAQGGKNDRLIQLPVVRVFYNGTFMVTIFFVISGYVLSHRPLGTCYCASSLKLKMFAIH